MTVYRVGEIVPFVMNLPSEFSVFFILPMCLCGNYLVIDVADHVEAVSLGIGVQASSFFEDVGDGLRNRIDDGINDGARFGVRQISAAKLGKASGNLLLNNHNSDSRVPRSARFSIRIANCFFQRQHFCAQLRVDSKQTNKQTKNNKPLTNVAKHKKRIPQR